MFHLTSWTEGRCSFSYFLSLSSKSSRFIDPLLGEQHNAAPVDDHQGVGSEGQQGLVGGPALPVPVIPAELVMSLKISGTEINIDNNLKTFISIRVSSSR